MEGAGQLLEGPGASCNVPDFATRLLIGKGDKRLWYPNERGTDLSALGGAIPFIATTEQAQYWVYFDPTWNPAVLTYDNYLQFFRDNVPARRPHHGLGQPEPVRHSALLGGKVLMWHGFADQLIVPGGSIDYYNTVAHN